MALSFSAQAQTVPNAPVDLTASAPSAFQISLSWTEIGTNEAGFMIERSLDGTNFTQIAQVLASTTNYLNNELFPGTTYYYRVRAYNSAGSSGYANVASAETPTPLCPFSIVGWGANFYGQIAVPAGLTNGLVAISAGGYEHSLALESNGTIVGWGANYYGETTTPTGLTGVAAIGAGGSHSLALKNNGTVVAWGAGQTNNPSDYYDYGQSIVPAGLSNVVAISGGLWHSLALKNDGTVVAWGAGQTNGPSDSVDDGQSIVPAGLSNVVAISAGGFHSLALTSDGTVVAWGVGQTNASGSHDYGQSIVPAGLSNVVAISAGYFHSLALKNDGTVVAWGAGQTNNPADYTDYGQSIVPAGLSNVVAISAGGYHSLALAISPGPPSGLTTMAVGPNEIDLSWSEYSSGVEEFEIERAPDIAGVPGIWAQLATVDVSVANYSDMTVAMNTAYWYRVRAQNFCSESAYAQTRADSTIFPRGTNLASLMVISQGNLPAAAQRLLVATLQGLVARQSGCQIYIDGGSGYSIWDNYLKSAYGIPLTNVTSPWSLVSQFKGLVSGYIRCNLSANSNSINAATSLCGPLNAVAVDTSIESAVRSFGITNLIADVSAAGDQFVWTNASPNYNAMLSRSVVVEQKPSFTVNLRDYATMANAFTFYEGNDSFRASVMGAMNSDAVCLGWGDASQGENVFVGADSTNGVVTIASDWALNLSTLGNVRDDNICQHTYTIPASESNVNYVTFVMTDGDNVQENLGSDPVLYQSSYRGQFNFGWSLSASLADLAPSVLRWYFDNASNGPNRDFFVAGPSGQGYFYPSMFPRSDLDLQIRRLNNQMTRADMDIVQILDFNSFYYADLWNQYLAQPNINALIYLEYSQYNAWGGAMYFSTNGKPILSCSDLIWGGLESPAQVVTNVNNAPRDPSSPASYKLVEFSVFNPTYPDLSYVMQVVTNLASYVRVVTPEEFRRLVVENVGRRLSYDFTPGAQGWSSQTSGWPYDQACWTNTIGNPPGALLMNGSHLGLPRTDMNSWFTRQIILPPNATTLSFDTLAVNDGLLQVELQPPKGGLVTLLPWAGLSAKNTWVTLTASLTNFAGQTVTLYFEQMDGGQGTNEYRYVDNVNILTAGPPLYLPAAPRLLPVAATLANGVSLLWRDNDNDETGFLVERSLGINGAWSQIASLATNVIAYTDLAVSPGTNYSYRVRSWNSSGYSLYSNVRSTTMPPIPSLSLVMMSNGALTLAWPSWATNYMLYTTTNLAPPVIWAPVTNAIANLGTNYSVTVPVGSGNCFFELRSP